MGSLFKRADAGGQGGYWYASFFDHTGKRCKVCTGTTEKTAARRIMAKLETDVALRIQGVINPLAERISDQSKRALSLHVSEFKSKLESGGRSEKHVRDTLKILQQVIDRELWTITSDITPEGVERHAAALRELKRSSRTVHKHLSTWKQFATWLYTTDRISADPLKSVDTPSPSTDRTYERRALRFEEWPYLEKATATGPERRSMPPADRALLYELTIQTGLRQNEIRSLTVGKFHLAQSPPFVILPGGSTKNRKPARQYVTRSLCERLRTHLATVQPGAPAFHLCDESRVAEVARADLAAARALYLKEGKTAAEKKLRGRSDFLLAKDHEGHVFDFHSLRHTCGAWLAHRGENPKTIQAIMRHSSITLTMDTYGHLFPASESDAIQRLSDAFGGGAGGDTSRAQ